MSTCPIVLFVLFKAIVSTSVISIERYCSYKNEGAPTTVETPSTTFMKTLAICLLYDNLLVVVNIYTLLGWLACKLMTIECVPHILI